MSIKEKREKMQKPGLWQQVWALYKEKKFIHVINAGFAFGMAFVYFETFIFGFGRKEIDLNIANAIVMMETFLVAFIIIRGMTFALEWQSKADELDRNIQKDALQIAHMFLIVAIIASLLSWSWHKNTTIIFHFVFFSLTISYALYHFINTIKYINFMAKPSLFELDSEE